MMKVPNTDLNLLVLEVRDFLAQQRVDSYLIGGYVRDALLGRATKDIDIAVQASALEVAQQVASFLGGRYVLLDERNKVARVVMLEGDSPYACRCYLDFSTLRGDITQDLAQRDFTIDAMAVRLDEVAEDWSKLELIDPFGGQSDLRKGLIRQISSGVFYDDPARLLRAVRLAAEYSLAIEEKTEASICSSAHLITTVAGERIREELRRLLSVPSAAYFLRYLDQLSLLEKIFPELAQTKGVRQPKEHFWDVFDHSMETVVALERLLDFEKSTDEILNSAPYLKTLAPHFEEEIGGMKRSSLAKLAALLHDIAKPKTKSIGEDGRTHFFGHAKEGAIIAGDILTRLRFSGREIKIVQKMIEYHLRPGQMSNEGLPTRRAIYRYFRDAGEVAIDTLLLGLADHLATRGPNLDLDAWEEHTKLVGYILSRKEESIIAPPKLIDGHDLINLFGMKPGRQIGELLELVREAQGAREINTREEALAWVEMIIENESKTQAN